MYLETTFNDPWFNIFCSVLQNLLSLIVQTNIIWKEENRIFKVSSNLQKYYNTWILQETEVGFVMKYYRRLKWKVLMMSSRWDISWRKKIIKTFVTWTNLYIVPQFKRPESEPNHLYNPQELRILKCLNVQDIYKLKKSYISTSNSKMKITFLEWVWMPVFNFK